MNAVSQHLIIDADDTLWEDALYFEEAIEEFLNFFDRGTLSRQQVRSVLDEIELAHNGLHPFGSGAFAENLDECYRRVAEHARLHGQAACSEKASTGSGMIDPDEVAHVKELGKRLLHQPRQLIPGVSETLQYLAPRHHLILYTKGHPVEQSLKVKSSGLAIFFRHIEIAREKNAGTYSELTARLGLDRPRTWMIGNSPKSDVNPALEAGLNAVYIPHAQTWRLEHEEISPGPGRLLVLERFSELRQHF
jgi:putative hydrolase of the HAD superfamily